MKTIALENEFIGQGDVRGFKFRKLESVQHGNLYEVDSGGSRVHFEVFERHIVPLCVDFEKRIYSDTQFKEIYPKSRDFGKWAWTYYDIDKAKKKLYSL